MTDRFLPEGRLLNTEENAGYTSSCTGLLRAMEEHAILEGTALLCGEGHDLVVKVGTFCGLMPREEAALGIAEGATRDIAILSRVGKPICFTVYALEGCDKRPSLLLSRRAAQQRAQEHILDTWRPGDIVDAAVTHLEPFGAFVDIGCGVPSMLGLDQISVSHAPHPRERFALGQYLKAAVTDVDREKRRVSLTHKCLLGTWKENAGRFSPGTTVTGVVRGIKPYGAFVELAPNLSGLAERVPELREGERVSVYIKSILPEKHKIKLQIIDRLPGPAAPAPMRYLLPADPLHWDYHG